MIEVGRLCVKTAGRDAMRHCVVVEIIDEKYVLVDGNTRRKKVNKSHLEPLNQVLKVKKGASTKEVLETFEKDGIPVVKSAEKKPAKKVSEKPKRTKPSQRKAETKKEKKSSSKKKE